MRQEFWVEINFQPVNYNSQGGQANNKSNTSMRQYNKFMKEQFKSKIHSQKIKALACSG